VRRCPKAIQDVSLADPTGVRAGHGAEGDRTIPQQAFERDQCRGPIVVQLDAEGPRIVEEGNDGCFT
jgi:hypothetical protein